MLKSKNNFNWLFKVKKKTKIGLGILAKLYFFVGKNSEFDSNTSSYKINI